MPIKAFSLTKLQERIINNVPVTFFKHKNPSGTFVSYDLFFTLKDKDYLVRYSSDSATGLTEEEIIKVTEVVVDFYK